MLANDFLRPVVLTIFLAGGCTGVAKNEYAVRNSTSAIQIGLDACVSKKVVRPSPPTMHAKLHDGIWHVWQAGRDCEVFSTDVDATTGIAGPCSVCVT